MLIRNMWSFSPVTFKIVLETQVKMTIHFVTDIFGQLYTYIFYIFGKK